VVLFKENHMQLIEAASLDRKSGVAEGSAVSGPRLETFFQRAELTFPGFYTQPEEDQAERLR
jgi:hypothetical protein